MQRFLLFILLSGLALAAPLAQASEPATPESQRENSPRYALAAAEALGSNLVIHLFDRFALRADYAQTTWATTARNLSSPWVFDHDSFTGNEIAHPYHGSLYFAAGRSNGVGFWGSAAYAALGSATWELFGENERPSINDLISTTMGGIVLGEISHRIYRSSGDSPFRIAASPMDALTEALTGDASELSGSRAGQGELALSFRAGMSFPALDMSETRGIESGRAEPKGQFFEALSYGDPFDPGSTKPFSHFQQRLRLGISPTGYEIAFFSNGSLWALPLVEGGRGRLTVGADLHYDFVFGSLVSLSANSVGLSLSAARRMPAGFALSGQLHLNAVALGTSDDVFLRERAEAEVGDVDFRNYDFGIGEGAKVYILLAHPGLGSLSLDYVAYGMHAIPAAQEVDSSFKYALIGILELAYERKVAEHLALGASYLLYSKGALYDPGTYVRENIQSVSMYVKIL